MSIESKPLISESVQLFLNRFPSNRVFVAYSGGLDSQTLLHLVGQVVPKKQLFALHVNHGLSENADKWQAHCQKRCDDFGVNFKAVTVSVVEQGDGPEAAARKARYLALEKFLESGDMLLMAHHQDDQIETFLLRLLRGSGIDGLSAMESHRNFGAGLLGRPLLNHTRAELLDYAEEQGIAWVEDESNLDPRFDRNYLRHDLFPIIEKRWPMYRKTIARSIQHIQQVSQGLNLRFDPLLKDRLTFQGGLKVVGFEELTHEDASGLVRHWLKHLGLQLPSEKRLNQVLSGLIQAKPDATPEVKISNYSIRRYQSAIFAVPRLPAIHDQWQDFTLIPDQPLSIPGCGTIALKPAIADKEPCLISERCLPLKIRFRIGGETMHPAGRSGSRDLKRLFQEYRLEPWWRDRLPLVYSNGQAAAAGHLFVCEGFQAHPGEAGYALTWEPPGFNS